MTGRRTDWQGVFPATVTPFGKDGTFDEKAFRALLELFITEGVRGVVVTGSTGEWYSMSDPERVRVWEVAVDAIGKRITLIAGTSAIGTREAVHLTRTAQAVGVDGCMVLPPSGIFASKREVAHYFHTVADLGLPVMVYNNPPRTGITIDAPLAAEICRAEGIVAFKESSRDLYAASEIIYAVGDEVAVFMGLEPYAASVLHRGAVGIVSTISNICAADVVHYFDRVVANDFEHAKPPQKRIDQLYHLMAAVGAPSFVFVKAAMALIGRPGGSIRLPHLPADAPTVAKIEIGLKELGLLDGEKIRISA